MSTVMRSSAIEARAAVLVITCVLAGCGAKSGLEVDRVQAPDAFRADASPDAFRADASDPERDAGDACPFDFDETIDATLRITADDNFRLFVQGVLIDDTPRDWHDVQTYVVPLFRHPAHRNTLAIEGTNVMRIDGLDRGVVAELTAEVEGRRSLVTDASWRLSIAPEVGWTAVDFDPSAWTPATVEGVNGIMPWGSVLGRSRAMWVWSYDSAIPASAKPIGETVALRRDFFFDRNGALRDTPGDCP